MEAPNRVPDGHFCLQVNEDEVDDHFIHERWPRFTRRGLAIGVISSRHRFHSRLLGTNFPPRSSLSLIHVPVNICADGASYFTVMRAEGGELGGLFLSKFSAQLWKWKTGSDGVASWVLGKTIELDKLLSIRWCPMILGFAEDNNVVFLRADMNVFTIQLQSFQFKNVGKTSFLSCCHPLESVYGAGMGIGGGPGGHGGADFLHDA